MPKPAWIRVRAASPNSRFYDIKRILREQKLHTVCEEASCPNIAECFGKGTATFMILGDICTRRCPFCDVAHGRPLAPDAEEPRHLAETIALLQLKYVVITSVDRDDLRDGGAQHFVDCISRGAERLRREPRIEVLVPDFRGRLERALEVLDARAAGRDEPQPRDRAAPVPQGAARRRLRAFTSPVEGVQATASRGADQVGPDGGAGRDRRGDPRRDARPARARRRHADDRPVPAAFAAPSAGGTLRRSGNFQGLRTAAPGRWASATPRSERWFAPHTTPTSRPTRPASRTRAPSLPAGGTRSSSARRRSAAAPVPRGR